MANLPPPESSASFWHSEPSEFLRGHRTTPDLLSEADVVIIGSGITGASAARYLAEDARAKHLSVVMLEAREACWGATGRNGGHCQPLLLEASNDVAAFEVRNVQAVGSYIEQNDVPCEWRSLTSCRTFWTQPLAEQTHEGIKKIKAASPELGARISYIDDQEGLKKHRVEGAAGAALTDGAASLWPYKLIAFILEKTIKAGRLNLQTKTPVTSLSLAEGVADRASFRHLVNTDRGTVKARHVVLATNAYTSHLLPEFSELIVPERGVMSALLPPAGMKRLQNSYGFVGAMGSNPDHDDYLVERPFSTVRNNDYLIERPFDGVPNPSGHLMFGGGRANAKLAAIGQTDDSIVDEGCAQYLKRMLLHLMDLGGETEGMKELEATKIWSGVWGSSQDSHPWVGAVPNRPGAWLSGGYSGKSHLYLSIHSPFPFSKKMLLTLHFLFRFCCHSGHGMPNATLCGKAVVEMVLGDESGAPHEYVTERLVRTGNLPQGYVITKDRIDRCKSLESVIVQDLSVQLEAERQFKNYSNCQDRVSHKS